MLNILIKYKGKNIWVLPLFILLFLDTLLGDWQNFTAIISGFHNNQKISIDEIYNWRSSLIISQRLDDIYRAKISENPTVSVIRHNSYISYSLPYSVGRYSQLILIQSQYQRLSGSNKKGETAVLAKLSGRGTNTNVLWTGTDGVALLGLKVHYSDDAYKTDFNILEFPSSEDKNMNDYFLKWLPGTFGNRINAPINNTCVIFESWGSTKISDKRIGLFFSHLDNNSNASFNYINSNVTQSLNGKRQLDLPVSMKQNRIAFSILSPDKPMSLAVIEVFKTKMSYKTNNQSFGVTDIHDLGGGDFSRTGISLQSDFQVGKNEFQTGISIVEYSGKFSLKTPILGYTKDSFIGLITLPIVHWAEVNIGPGSSFSQKLKWSRRFLIKKTNLNCSGEYIHSQYKFNVQGEAHLECGLISSPIDYPINITANMFNFKTRLRRQFNNFTINYAITQIIPIINRTDDSPVRFTEQIPGKKVVKRGGQTHQLFIEYRF